MAGKLTKTQRQVIEKMQQGSVIGELSDKINGRYELFTNDASHEGFNTDRLNKNTVFALLALGLIQKNNSIARDMLPFSRDVWYVFRGNK